MLGNRVARYGERRVFPYSVCSEEANGRLDLRLGRTFSRFPKTRSPFTVDSPGSHANDASPAPVASSGSDDLGRHVVTKL